MRSQRGALRAPIAVDYNDGGVREYHYRVNREGQIFHDGTEIVDAGVLRFFLRAMKRTEDGRYVVLCQGERNWFYPHDTPFVIQRLRCVVEDGRLSSVELCFAGDYRQPLDSSTLESDGGALFCHIQGRAMRARFGRVALQQLAPYLVGGEGGSALLQSGVCYPVRALSPVTI